ncbi:MAG: hypothetical protein J7J32_04265, partial [Candidatus Atribacteria bacterium]|nr:hypothetical protein [Candidatus Atribacteria bacterium]MCD6349901.1 hypothetical protein [Candidatus Atribacteria bacterium]
MRRPATLTLSLLFVFAFFAFSVVAFAQEEADLVAQAASLLREGNLEEAQKLLDEVRLLLWNKAPMKVENYTFVEEESESYGVYRERISNFFAPDETIYVYAEPKNYTIRKEDNTYHIYFDVGFNLYDKEGNYIGGQDSFGSFRYITRSPVYETYLNLFFECAVFPLVYYVLCLSLPDT